MDLERRTTLVKMLRQTLPEADEVDRRVSTYGKMLMASEEDIAVAMQLRNQHANLLRRRKQFMKHEPEIRRKIKLETGEPATDEATVNHFLKTKVRNVYCDTAAQVERRRFDAGINGLGPGVCTYVYVYTHIYTYA